MFDVLIIGAGITGTMLARKLSAYKLKIALVDRENDIAEGATMANSAIVHTGYDPEDGTLKALLNVKGARQYKQLCETLSCGYKQTGAFVAACGGEEEKVQDVLVERAKSRGIAYEILSGEEARQQEPNLSDDVTRVVSFPETAVIYPWEVAIACAETAVNNGVELYLNHPVNRIEKNDDGYLVYAGDRMFQARTVVNAAGTGAERIAAMVTDHPGFSIRPKKGEYFVIDNDIHYVDHIIYPVPTDKGKGVLAVPTVYGNTLLGPDSEPVPELDDTSTSFAGLQYVRDNLNRILKNPPLHKVIRNFAGLRPSTDRSDFILEEAPGCPGFINAASIESPGLASAPAVADYIIENLLQDYLSWEENPAAVMGRPAPVVMAALSEEERRNLIAADPRYGRIICRCEQISEGEIVAAIHRTCGARSVKAVKKRVRPGMGRCQGGFCEPRVLAILARELSLSPVEVVLDRPASRILEKENRADETL